MRESLQLGMLAVPSRIDSAEVRRFLEALPGVSRVHDLHIWPMSTTEAALTAHLVIPGGAIDDDFLHEVAHELEHRFAIGHPTLQIETAPVTRCSLESAHVV